MLITVSVNYYNPKFEHPSLVMRHITPYIINAICTHIHLQEF